MYIPLGIYFIAVRHSMVRDRTQLDVWMFILLVDGFSVSNVENNHGKQNDEVWSCVSVSASLGFGRRRWEYVL